MSETNPAVWALFCYSDRPYFVENQWRLLGVFSTEANAGLNARRHDDEAQLDRCSIIGDCESVIIRLEMDEYQWGWNS